MKQLYPRYCDVCGKGMSDGYCDGVECWCSLECLGMTQKEVDEQYKDDGEDCIYWTEWEGIDYDEHDLCECSAQDVQHKMQLSCK